MKNFTEVLSEAKKMQKKMQEVQEKLKTIEAEGIAGGDTVKVVLNGEYELFMLNLNKKKVDKTKKINKPSLPVFNKRPSRKKYKKHINALCTKHRIKNVFFIINYTCTYTCMYM